MYPEDIIESVLAAAMRHGAEFAEAVVVHSVFSLKRLAGGRLDQVPAREQWVIDVSVGKHGRLKSVRFDNPLFADEAMRFALETIDRMPERRTYPPQILFPSVANRSGRILPEQDNQSLIDVVVNARTRLKKFANTLSGKVVQGMGTIAYGNTAHTVQSQRFSLASVALFAFDDGDPSRSAYASSGGSSLEDIDIERVAYELTHKLSLMHGKKKIDASAIMNADGVCAFDLIAEPYFFERIFKWLGLFGWNGLFMERGTSVFSGEIGRRFLSDMLTVRDNPFDPRLRGMGWPFDLEGRPRTNTTLIEKGVPITGVYDNALAEQCGRKSTGNALLPSRRTRGAVPYDIVVEGGDTSIEEMIRSTKRPALWVTRLHYLGTEDRQTAALTGIAQHGVFLVDGGRVVGPAENVRFELSVPEAFSRIEALSASRLVLDPRIPTTPSACVLPAMKIQDIAIVGSTGRDT